MMIQCFWAANLDRQDLDQEKNPTGMASLELVPQVVVAAEEAAAVPGVAATAVAAVAAEAVAIHHQKNLSFQDNQENDGANKTLYNR